MKHRRIAYLLVVLLLQAPLLAAQVQEAQTTGSTEKGSEPAARPVISLGIGSQALAEAYPDQARWLDTAGEEQVLVMFEQEQTARPRGAVLILADEGQTANTRLAGALRQPLTRAGWAAMAMGLPELPIPLAQARRMRESSAGQSRAAPAGDQDGQQEQGNNGSAQDASSVMIDVMATDNLESLARRYESGVQAGLEAALAELREQGYERLVLVALGRAAELATRQALAGDQGVQALVWVAPTLANDTVRTLAVQLEASSLPVLELASSWQADNDNREREAIMRRQGVAAYSQQAVAMASQPVARNADQLVNRILAWLSR